MTIYSKRIKKLRLDKNMSQEQLASLIGITRNAISMYENGKREPDLETCEAIADIFNVDMDYLTGRSNIERKYIVTPPPGWEDDPIPQGFEPMPAMRKVPLLGTIHCGAPTDNPPCYEGDINTPDNVKADFALKCKGDSMINARIFDGDIVYIRRQTTVENGQIAAVAVDGENTLKRVYFYPDHVLLQPENPTYPPIVLWGERMNELYVYGKAVAFTSMIP